MNKGLLATSVFALSAFLIFALDVNEFTVISDSRASLKERNGLLEERTAFLANVKELGDQYKLKQAEVNKLSVFLPENNRVDQIISGLQAAALESGLKMKTLTVSRNENQDTGRQFNKATVKAELSGTYPILLNFLKKIEQSLRLYDVSKIIVSRDTSPGSSGFNLEIQSVTYSSR